MNDTRDDGFEGKLDDMAGRLSRDVMPERDLWPAIEASIAGETGSGRHAPLHIPLWQRYLAQAAAVVLLVGGSSGLTYLAVKGDRNVVSPVAADMPLHAVTASFGGQYTLGPDFQDARRDLEGRLEEELKRLSPAARAEVETNMATIRAAIDEINVALVNEPNNALLQELLLSSYQEELDLMRKVNGITSSVMLRDDF